MKPRGALTRSQERIAEEIGNTLGEMYRLSDRRAEMLEQWGENSWNRPWFDGQLYATAAALRRLIGIEHGENIYQQIIRQQAKDSRQRARERAARDRSAR